MTGGDKYYGGYFWIALISFIVPWFVAWKAFDNLKPTTKPVPQVDSSGVDHAIWDYLLKSYVNNGLVDYDGMKKDYLFREYLRELGACNPDKLETDNEKLALACNAYNAFVINAVISHGIYDSVKSVDGFFGLQEHIFAGETISLNDLENIQIRATFFEPRIHVGLVCAARSCPSIRAQAFTGDQVLDQLEDQSRLFANNPIHVAFDSESNVLSLSKILQWYGTDFDKRYPDGSYFTWLQELVEDPKLKEALAGAAKKEVEVAFFEYDWALNSQADPGEAPKASKSSGGFGSGASPDE